MVKPRFTHRIAPRLQPSRALSAKENAFSFGEIFLLSDLRYKEKKTKKMSSEEET